MHALEVRMIQMKEVVEWVVCESYVCFKKKGGGCDIMDVWNLIVDSGRKERWCVTL